MVSAESASPSTAERPTWDLINCMIVWVISLLATCLRLSVGVLLWDPRTKQIVSVGYNGAPKGMPHCLDSGCEMEGGHCVRCLHGDTNALYWAGTRSQGCWMYLNYSPCRRCVNHIIQGGITRVIFTEFYGSYAEETNEILRMAGIDVSYFPRVKVYEGFLTLLPRLVYNKSA